MLLLAAVANLALILLVPPYDYVSMTRNNVPTFEGFQFVFGDHGTSMINNNFLQIELFVVLINASIGWLLLNGHLAQVKGKKWDWQKVVLAGTALNLVLALLFPPWQNYRAVTNATLPSFDGFYFLFDDHSKQTLVIPILYMELVFIVVNGALLWLLFRHTRNDELDATARALMNGHVHR